ncbi:aminopeptidase [Halolamina salina]|uniref:Aminopeptidase n=1 Tax=Halolamina salina TaxID=1220023 RepID=A0ABD6B8M8_9EURY
MDDRIQRHAEILVDHCTDVSAGENVAVSGPPVAEELLIAVAEKLGEVGANASTRLVSQRASRAYRRAIDPDDVELSEHVLAMAEETDVMINVGGATNTHETGDVDPETNAAFAAANKAVQEARMGSRWVTTAFPAPGNAQDAEMSTPAYEEFVWSAIDKDWEQQREFQAQMVEILEDASEVRIVSGDTTDVTMRVDGMLPQNDYGEKNMPGGEVYTAPIKDSVEGEVLFDKPLMAQGREVEGVQLTFEDGKVVDHAAEKNEDVLTEMLDTDEGARYLGELGIGMNRDIDRFTYNMLFDEKMGDTVHMAIGRAYEWTVPEDRERNDSAVHMDMIVDMSEDSRIEVDGEVVQEDGTFVFEE